MKGYSIWVLHRFSLANGLVEFKETYHLFLLCSARCRGSENATCKCCLWGAKPSPPTLAFRWAFNWTFDFMNFISWTLIELVNYFKEPDVFAGEFFFLDEFIVEFFFGWIYWWIFFLDEIIVEFFFPEEFIVEFFFLQVIILVSRWVLYLIEVNFF